MSNGNVAVALFNTNSSSLQIVVNNGSPVSIAGTGPSQNWVPQQPNPNPISANNGYPAPNVFGVMAPNQVQVIVNGTPVSAPLQISIPQSAPVFSLQLYIFFSYSSVSWTLLNGGQLIGSGTAISDAAMMMMAAPKKAPSKSKSKGKKG
jgi:hypothetical protein